MSCIMKTSIPGVGDMLQYTALLPNIVSYILDSIAIHLLKYLKNAFDDI